MKVELMGVLVSPEFKEFHDENCHDCGGNCIMLDGETFEDFEEAQALKDAAK